MSRPDAHPRRGWRRPRARALLAHPPRPSRRRALRRAGQRRHRRRWPPTSPSRPPTSTAIVAWCGEHRPGPRGRWARTIRSRRASSMPSGRPGSAPSDRRAAAARIEASKAWATEVCTAAGVPMPESHVFDDADEADAFVRERGEASWSRPTGWPWARASSWPRPSTRRSPRSTAWPAGETLGAAGERLVLQERLTGPEASVFAICDGRDLHVIGAARDYKRIGDGDQGPNTGGMGAYTPARRRRTPRRSGEIEQRIIAPVLAEMRRCGAPFTGFLYAGPDADRRRARGHRVQRPHGRSRGTGLLPLLGFDLVDGHGRRHRRAPRPSWSCRPGQGAAVCVVLASGGYPGSYTTGLPHQRTRPRPARTRSSSTPGHAAAGRPPA